MGNLSQIPAYDGAFAGKSKDDWQPLVDWGYITSPQLVSTLLAMTFKTESQLICL